MKRYFFVVSFLLTLSCVAQANVTLVQHRSIDAGITTSASLDFASSNGLGDWIGICVRGGNSSSQVFTVSDSNGNTYRQAAQIGFTGSAVTLAIYYSLCHRRPDCPSF